MPRALHYLIFVSGEAEECQALGVSTHRASTHVAYFNCLIFVNCEAEERHVISLFRTVGYGTVETKQIMNNFFPF